jgi:hypothetical protein
MPPETGDAPMAHDDDAAAAGQAPECQFCPLCAGLAALREARPEAVEHLVKAGAELLLAARALLDGAAEPAGRPAPGRRPRSRRAAPGDAGGNGLQRIDVG